MKQFKYLFFGMAAAVAVSLSSCGDSKSDEPGQGGDGSTWTDEEKKDAQKITSEEEAKEYLGETAEMVMDKFKPADQREFVQLAASFADTYGDYELDLSGANFSKARKSKGVSKLFAQMRAAVATGNYMNLSRAAANVIEFGMITGVYEPNTKREVFYRAADSSDFIVRFYDGGVSCEFKVTASKDTWTLDGDMVEDGDEFDAVKVPRTINFSLVKGAKTLVSGVVKSNWAEDKEASLSTEVTLMNIRVNASVNATNSVISTDDHLYVDGTEIVGAKGTVNGNNMVKASAIEKIFDKEVDRYEWWNGYEYVYDEDVYYELNPNKATNMFRNAEANAKLLGRVNVVASAPDSKLFLDIEDTYFDAYDYGSDAQAKSAANAAAKQIEKAVKANLYLAGNTTATASMKWQARKCVYEGYGWSETWWEVEPVLLFEDGTTYGFGDFGVNDFANIEARLESLVNGYISMVKAAL